MAQYNSYYKKDGSSLTYQTLYLQWLDKIFELRHEEELAEYRRAVSGLEICMAGRDDDLFIRDMRELDSKHAKLVESKGRQIADVWYFDEKAKLLISLVKRVISENIKAREHIYDSEIIKMIKKELKNKRGQNLIITGPTGLGKSWTAVALALEAVRDTDIPFDITTHVCFTPEQFSRVYNDEALTPPGSVIIFDEIGVTFGSRDALTAVNRTFSKLLQIIRHRAVLVIFTTPDLSFMDNQGRKMMHYWFKAERIDRKKNWCVLTPYRVVVDQNTSKVFYMFPKIEYSSLDKLLVHRIPEDVAKEYEKVSKAYKDTVAKNTQEKFEALESTNPKYELFVEYRKKGLKLGAIAETMGVDRKTITKYNKTYHQHLLADMRGANNVEERTE